MATEGVKFPAIGDYGAVGDSRTVALISRDGSVDWLCLPHFSGRAMFASLLDQECGGRFQVRPSEPYESSRRYLNASNVLETSFRTDGGEATVTDCLTMLPQAEPEGVLTPQSELLRRIEVRRGNMALDVTFCPRPDFGRLPVHLARRSDRTFVLRHRDLYLVLQSEIPLDLTSRDAVTGTLHLRQGEPVILSLSFVQQDMGILPPLGDEAAERLDRTRQWWQNWIESGTWPSRQNAAVRRSALVLKMLQHGLTGAIMAAPTTSLPEQMGGNRNWDYRFCWLRDAALAFQAFTDLGYHPEGEQFLGWLLHATRLSWPQLNVLYDAFGETHLTERELDHLSGYKNSRPVRVGNAAYQQLQLDVYGAIIQAAADYASRGGELDVVEGRLLTGFGRMICRCWREPDSSIWEIRGPRRQYTYSKMMCWSGLNELLRLDEGGHVRVPREQFTAVRDDIGAAIERYGFSPRRNSYVQTFDGDEADASLLLAARHYQDPSHPRMTGTFEYVARELSEGPLVHRYRPGSDGMGGQEGAFVVTSFWAVEYLASAGRLEEAESRFEALLGMSNDLGLFAEEIDPQSGAALGNFPQAFSHLGLVTAAMALERARQGKQATHGYAAHGG